MKTKHNSTSEVPLVGLEKYYSEFLASRILDINVLKTNVENNNYISVMAIAHRLRGFCAPYGFGELGFLAEELEIFADEKNKENCLNIIERMKAYLDQK